MRAVLALLALCLCGCSTLQLEGSWQVAHAVDVAQSFHGAASDRCYSEGDPVTKLVTGAHPDHTRVLLWGIGYAGLHYAAASWLEGHAPKWASQAFEWVTLADTGYSIARNYSIGIRIGRPNTDYPQCPEWARP